MPQKFVPLHRCYAPPRASLLRRSVYFFARRSYGRLLQRNYRIEHINADFLRTLPAPYVLLANHVTNEDPFIYNILCPYPIAWVIGKSIERDFKFPWLLRTIRTISRSKEMNDVATIKKIQQRITEGEVVGIFPEGQTSFTGVSHDIPEASAKLLRLLKVPVVSLRNEGGYFVQPRWAWQRRTSHKIRDFEACKTQGIRLHYELLFDREEIQTANLSEIYHKIRNALHYDPYASYPGTELPYLNDGLRRQNLAESMELLFYSCMHCRSSQSLGAMQSKGMKLYCMACNAAWRISDDSCLVQHKNLYYNLEQYYRGQRKLLGELAEENKLELRQKIARLRCYTPEAERLCLPSSVEWQCGSLRLDAHGLLLEGAGGSYHFALDQLFGSHVFKQNIWEFHAYTDAEKNQSQLFVLEFPRKNDSAFLLLDSLKALQEVQHKAWEETESQKAGTP